MKRIFANLAGSSVLWGLVLTFAFYYALNQGYVENETVLRYSVGHPVEYLSIGMFWIGLCDLLFKLGRTGRERRALRRGALFPPKTAAREPVANVANYLESIDKARAVRGDSAYLERLRGALEFLRAGGSPDDLDLELRRLADDAYDDRDGEYGMVRALIWAIPILGFLGTVLGITVALGSLDLTQIETTSEKLAAGLKVAFDTTALALSLVFVLYFVQFFSRRRDAALARGIAKMADSELKGRFRAEETSADSPLDASGANVGAILESLARALTRSLEESSRRQTEALSASVRGLADEFGAALDRRLSESGGSWLESLADAQSRFVEGAVAPALGELSKRAERFDSLEDKVAQEIEALRQTLRACADVAAIEDRLSSSLKELAQVNEFEKTLSNLNATVCMLNSRLAAPTSTPSLDEARRAVKRSETLAALRALDEKPEAPARETYPLRSDIANQTDDAPSAPPVPTPPEDASDARPATLDVEALDPALATIAPLERFETAPAVPELDDRAARSRALLSKKKKRSA